MVHRDPQTGKFVAEGGEYDDIEAVTFRTSVGLEAANLGGQTNFDGNSAAFEGVEVVDYDEVVDRNERLELLTASHGLTVYSNSTQTADGTVRGVCEVSASPSRSQIAGGILTGTEPEGPDSVVGDSFMDDSIDLVGRPLIATGQSAFSDGATGVGGGGSAGEDSVELQDLPAQMAEFHPRDQLYVNGQFETWNIDDAGIHAELVGQHLYGVVQD